MPRRSSDPLVNELNRVKQRIYRLDKQGLKNQSSAYGVYKSKLRKAGIDISKPVNQLSPAQREKLHKLNESFIANQTSSIRQLKKLDKQIGDKLIETFERETGGKANQHTRDLLIDAFKKYHDKDSKLDNMLGSDVILQSTKIINAKYKDPTRAGNIFAKRYEKAIKYIEKHQDNYTEEDLINILYHGKA